MKHKLFYPSAISWMWDYCIYLGPFISSNGTKFDLGVYTGTGDIVAAIVYGDTPGEYISGELDQFGRPGSHSYEAYEETRKRASYLGLYQY